MGAYKGIMKFGTNVQKGLLAGLGAYGTLKAGAAAASEIYTAGRGLFMAANALRGPVAVAGAAMLAI